jgi:hypothetical protein
MEAVRYRVVALFSNGQRLILDESLELNRAEQMRDLVLKLETYDVVQVEQDVADQTPRLTDGTNGETIAFSN